MAAMQSATECEAKMVEGFCGASEPVEDLARIGARSAVIIACWTLHALANSYPAKNTSS